MATLDPEYCKEKALQKEYLIDIMKGFKEVLRYASIKHSKMKTVPKIRVVGMLTKLLNL